MASSSSSSTLAAEDPRVLLTSYAKLEEWVFNSLDSYRNELLAFLFPLYVSCFIKLVRQGHAEAAREFFSAHATQHWRAYAAELRALSQCQTYVDGEGGGRGREREGKGRGRGGQRDRE